MEIVFILTYENKINNQHDYDISQFLVRISSRASLSWKKVTDISLLSMAYFGKWKYSY